MKPALDYLVTLPGEPRQVMLNGRPVDLAEAGRLESCVLARLADGRCKVRDLHESGAVSHYVVASFREAGDAVCALGFALIADHRTAQVWARPVTGC